MNWNRFLLGIFVLISLAGVDSCEDGGDGDCPFDPPRCCYNVLFGCGPFDLPEGCSCRDYGLFFNRNISSNVMPMKNASMASPLLGKEWMGTLMQTGGTCSSAPKQVSGIVIVNRRKDGRVTIAVPGYGNLVGRVRGSTITANGSFTPLFSSCRSQVATTMKKVNSRLSPTRSTFKYVCRSEVVCDAAYSGVLKHF